MATEFNAYRFADTELSDEELNRRMLAIDKRFHALEEAAFTFSENEDALRAVALQRISDALTPVLAIANMGDLLRASAVTEHAIGSGAAKTFIVNAEDRAAFAGPLYIIAAVNGTPDKWMAGQVTAWDNATGELVVNITNSRGTGTYTAWDITVASIPPEVPASQMAEDIAINAIGGLASADVQAALAELQAGKVGAASPAFTGVPTAPTAPLATNTTQLATTAFVAAAIAALVDAAPGTLDTLNELAAALGDDANFASTITTALAGKQAASANLDTWAGTTQATAADYRTGTASTKALVVANVWGAWAEVALTYAATITPDFSAGFDFAVTLTGNATLANPTNLKPGQRGRIRIVQDGTGSRTMAYGSYWKFAGSSTPTLSTAASTQDFLDYEVVTTTRIRAALTKAVP